MYNSGDTNKPREKLFTHSLDEEYDVSCFFSQLGNLLPTTIPGKFRRIYVTTGTESTTSIVFHKGNLIPDQFLQATLGPRIGSHCLHVPSSLMEKDRENSKEKRSVSSAGLKLLL